MAVIIRPSSCDSDPQSQFTQFLPQILQTKLFENIRKVSNGINEKSIMH